MSPTNVCVCLVFGICFWIQASEAACTGGGCISSTNPVQDACFTVITRYRTVYYNSGWWTSQRRKTRSQAIYSQSSYYCCPGYILVGNKCYSQTCGGCGSSSVSSQRACRDTRTVTVAVSSTQSYKCNWWGTCYRKVYKSETRLQPTLRCCAGFRLNGENCDRISDSTPPPGQGDCGRSQYPDPGDRLSQIVGGIQTRPNEFPWQVRVVGPGNTLCGGTLISNLYVLTAAHCVEGVSSTGMSLVAGDHSRSRQESTEQARTSAQITRHPAYDSQTLSNDIALVRLSSAVTLSPAVRPACLPAPNGNYQGRDVVISGWGSTDDTSPTATTLRFTVVQVTTKSTCVTFFGPLHHVICATDGAGNRERSSCFGDSGGPMALKQTDGTFQVVGVASFVSAAGCAAGRPFGYTDVSRYISWIQQTAGPL